MLCLLFVILFLIITSTINAVHVDAYKWDNECLKTATLEDIYNMKKGDSITWYYKLGTAEPTCKFNTFNLNIDYLDVKYLIGNQFDSNNALNQMLIYGTLKFLNFIKVGLNHFIIGLVINHLLIID